MDKDPRDSLAAALLSDEYWEEEKIASFTHDGSSSHSMSHFLTYETETKLNTSFTEVEHTFGVQEVKDEVLILH